MPREQTIASRLATIAAMAVVAFSASCTIGPKYVKPSAPVPPAYKEVGASNVSGDWKLARPSDDAARGRWWERFNDPRLNQLEEKLNISNQNIVAAAANVQAARAMIR